MVLCAADTKTKIVCTIGPASCKPDVLRDLIREGMDVARINFSHGTHSEHEAIIGQVRQAATDDNAVVAIMADLQGPKLRIGRLADPLQLSVGEWVSFTDQLSDGSHNVLPLPHPEVISGACVGQRLLLDDGAIELEIRETRPDVLVCIVVVGGKLSSHKGVAVPDGVVAISALTDKDREDAGFAVSQGVDFLALSFVRSPDDVRELRNLLRTFGPDGERVHIVAKIESRHAVARFDEILPLVNVVMVARGDLGVELSPQEVPFHQKEIIHRCNWAGVPVITATQMLQSMIENPRPTRAESSDVANAILDGTDAVMLSAETAVGRYPVEAVRMIREISTVVEERMLKRAVGFPENLDEVEAVDHVHLVTDAICDATAQIAAELDVHLIATATWSGYTARQIARKRPKQAIVAFTPDPNVQRQLAMVWGVSPLLVPAFENTDSLLEVVSRTLLDGGDGHPGDWIILTGGFPVGGGGKTNFIKVHRI
ncbi:pyruvate kinase [Candidatus Bipolaricaulota bacterium]|nr:pyruvate kinase [Candidatus Bipolaricaulota bacterium]